MITLLTGENSFEIERELRRISKSFEGEPERFDGADIELRQLPDLLMGLSLFAEKRLVIIRELSSNKSVWEALPELLARMSPDIHLVLVEPSADKRLKAYKAVHKIADSKDFTLLTQRDSATAERWVKEEAERLGMKLDRAAIQSLLQRGLVLPERGQPVIDQWYIYHALEKLSVFDTVTVALVEQYIDAQPVDSVFSIFETALRGDERALHQLLANVALSEDPFRVFGLLSGQVFQLAALALSDQPAPATAKAIGVHPYAASKLTGFAKKLTRQQVRRIVQAFADADEALKLSKAEPWTLVELALMKTAHEVRAI
jgi:DNA polymerase III delta subunit